MLREGSEAVKVSQILSIVSHTAALARWSAIVDNLETVLTVCSSITVLKTHCETVKTVRGLGGSRPHRAEAAV